MITKLAVAVGGLTAAVAALYGAGAASADTHVCIGGYTDPDSQILANVKEMYGDPCDVQIHWPAALGVPGVDATNTQGSLDVGVPATVQAYYDAGGGNGAPVRLDGHSLGALVSEQAGDAIRIQNGGTIPPNLTVIASGNVYGDSGLQHDPGVGGIVFDVAKPMFGMPQDIPQMGINRNDLFDIYGNGANQMPQTQIADASTIPWNHVAPDPNLPHETYFSDNDSDPATPPVQNEIYNRTGEQNPISAAAAANGTPVDPATDAFLDVTFPVNNPAEVAHSDVASFFGELPCPGGYFTPGDAPC